MQLRVLFSTTFNEEAQFLTSHLSQERLMPVECHSGKKLLKEIQEKGAFAAIINVDTKNDFSLEVIKQINLYHPQVRIILTFQSVARYNFYRNALKNFSQLGIADVFVYPYTAQSLLESIKGKTVDEELRKRTRIARKSKPTSFEDITMFKTNLQALSSGNLSPFTIFQRTKDKQYIPLIFKGHYLPQESLRKLEDSELIDLYYSEIDRQNYINVIHHNIHKIDLLAGQKIGEAPSFVIDIDFYLEKFISEGIKRHHAMSASMAIANALKLIQADMQLTLAFSEYINLSKQHLEHIMRTAYIALCVCQNHKSCKSKSTLDMMALASLLHEIGLIKIAKNIRDKRIYNLFEDERGSYYDHIHHSVETLSHTPLLNEQIRQTISQHCEFCDGTGIPMKMLGAALSQESKILSFANGYADFIEERGLGLFEGLEVFLFNSYHTKKYDSKVLTSFVKSLYLPRKRELQQGFL